MSAWWDQVLQSPAFLSLLGESLASRTQARATYERAMDTAMDRMHLPNRKDIGRVARIATLLEERLLAQEDLLLEVKDQLVEARRDAVRARIEAVEARLEAQQELEALRAELAALQQKLGEGSSRPAPATEPPAERPARRGRKP